MPYRDVPLRKRKEEISHGWGDVSSRKKKTGVGEVFAPRRQEKEKENTGKKRDPEDGYGQRSW